jgi:hypothetical protein
MKEINYTEGTPVDRLGRIAAAMTDAMPVHPEASGHERVIVVLTDPEARDCMTHSCGYEQGTEGVLDSISDLYNHLRALCAAIGMDVQILPLDKVGRG